MGGSTGLAGSRDRWQHRTGWQESHMATWDWSEMQMAEWDWLRGWVQPAKGGCWGGCPMGLQD